MGPPLVLGSASPRRRELLASIGLPCEVLPADVEEPAPGSLPPEELVRESARLKARAVARLVPGRLLLAADTIVALDASADSVLGKPADRSEAAGSLRRLSGRSHRVLTAVVLERAGAPGGQVEGLSETEVRFAPLSESFVERYVATGESLDKAGAYGAQGLAGTEVLAIRGSWTNVVGLPLELLPGLFAELGEELQDWQDW